MNFEYRFCFLKVASFNVILLWQQGVSHTRQSASSSPSVGSMYPVQPLPSQTRTFPPPLSVLLHTFPVDTSPSQRKLLALVSPGFCNNSKFGSFKSQKFLYSFGGQKSKIKGIVRTALPQKFLGRILSGHFWFLGTPAVPWLVAASLQFLPQTSYGFLLPLSLLEMLVLGFRAHLDDLR